MAKLLRSSSKEESSATPSSFGSFGSLIISAGVGFLAAALISRLQGKK
jgi:hypothetical protein